MSTEIGSLLRLQFWHSKVVLLYSKDSPAGDGIDHSMDLHRSCFAKEQHERADAKRGVMQTVMPLQPHDDEAAAASARMPQQYNC